MFAGLTSMSGRRWMAAPAAVVAAIAAIAAVALVTAITAIGSLRGRVLTGSFHYDLGVLAGHLVEAKKGKRRYV